MLIQLSAKYKSNIWITGILRVSFPSWCSCCSCTVLIPCKIWVLNVVFICYWNTLKTPGSKMSRPVVPKLFASCLALTWSTPQARSGAKAMVRGRDQDREFSAKLQLGPEAQSEAVAKHGARSPSHGWSCSPGAWGRSRAMAWAGNRGATARAAAPRLRGRAGVGSSSLLYSLGQTQAPPCPPECSSVPP